MKKVLLSWSSNWADEMDVAGFVIVNEHDAHSWRERLESKGGFDLSIGTNEEISYASGNDLLDEVDETPLSDKEAEVIEGKIGSTFGHTEFYAYALEAGEDEYEDEDDGDDYDYEQD